MSPPRNYKTPRGRTVAELRNDFLTRTRGRELLDERCTKIGANLTLFRDGRCLIIRYGISEHLIPE